MPAVLATSIGGGMGPVMFLQDIGGAGAHCACKGYWRRLRPTVLATDIGGC